MSFLEVSIKVDELQEVLIALLADSGFDGFEQEEGLLRAYVPELRFNAHEVQALLAAFGVVFSVSRIEERNWNEEWERSFQPVVVEGFCSVRAQFHAPIPDTPHDLVITPKMSFGTGHHATTYMMLEAMQQLSFSGSLVLDFGTGTGVLAILAERLGAGAVLAIDNDDWSIANAQENVRVNGCSRISVAKRDSLTGLEGPFDVILANINKHVILEQLPSMEQHLAEGGVILCSGLLLDDSEEIENEAAKNKLSISKRTSKGSWIALQAEKMK